MRASDDVRSKVGPSGRPTTGCGATFGTAAGIADLGSGVTGVMVEKDCVPYGSGVSGGAFACTDCGHGIQTKSGDSLPPCPTTDDTHTKVLEGLYGQGDAPEDPQA